MPRTVQNQNFYKRAIVNDRKCKSSHIHVLCDDWCHKFFFAWGQENLSPVCTGDCIPFFVECNQSDNQFKKNLKTLNRTKETQREQNDLALFCVHWTQKQGPKPLKNLEGGQFAVFRKNLDFLRLQMRLGCVLEEERNYTAVLPAISQFVIYK